MLIYLNYLLAWMQLFFCYYILMFEYKRKSSAFFLWAMLFVVWGLPHFLTCVFFESTYSSEVLLTASLFSCLFSILYLIVRMHIKHKIWFSLKEYLNHDVTKVSKLLLYSLCIVVFFQLLDIYRYTGSLWNSSWVLRREMSMQKSYLSFDMIMNYSYYILSSVLLMFLLKKDYKNIIVSFLTLLLGALISRQRADLLPLIISIISLFVLCNNSITAKKILAISISGMILLYVVFALQIFRYGGSISNFVDNVNWIDFNNLVWEKMLSGEGDFGLREAFYYFIDQDNNFKNFGEGHTYIRMLLLCLPTQWSFGIKPPDFAVSMGMAWRPELGGDFTMHPTLLGDCYANFGFLGVIGGGFWALIVNIIDSLIRKFSLGYRIPCFVTCSSCFVLIGRGSVYNGFGVMFYSILILFILEYLTRFRFKLY